MSAITIDGIISAVLVVAILLIISSVPSILLTVRHSSKLLKRYRILRSIEDLDDEKNVSEQVLNEWNAVKSQMAYTTLITEELEKLSGLKPAFFQAEIAAIIIIILAITPGFSEVSLTVVMVAVAILAILSVFYAAVNTANYRKEYLVILKEMSENEKDTNNGAADGMYG